MKGQGVNNNSKFILTTNAPILEINKGKVEESSKKLLDGTVIEGTLVTRVVNTKRKKVPFRFIKLDNKLGYLSPRVVNLYVDYFANTDGLSPESKSSETPVKDTSFGEKKGKTKTKKAKNFIINYGLPLGGAIVGYQIAKKRGGDTKTLIGYTVAFGLLGAIPRYLYKDK